MGTDHGAIAATRGLALEVADVILQVNPSAQNQVGADVTGADLARPLTDALTDSFIVQPAMLLQYGQVFDGHCAKAYTASRLSQLAYDQAVADQMAKLQKATDGIANALPLVGGLVSSGNDAASSLISTWARDHFGDPPMSKFEKQCVTGDPATARKASLDKVGGAGFLLIAALIVAALITALAGSFLIAQVRIAWDAIRGEGALVAGTIPGAGRSWLWDWCSSVLRSLAQMLVSVIALAVFIVVIQAVLTPAQNDWGKELTLRFLVVDVVCIAAVKQRRRIADRTRQVGAAWRTRMSAGRVGGTGGSVFAAPASATIAKRPRIARTAARVAVRSAMAGVSLAQGNPLAAIGYAMLQSIGATALMSRLATGNRTRRAPGNAARPAGRRPPTQGGNRRPAQQNTRPNPGTRSQAPTIEMPAVPSRATGPSDPPTIEMPPVPRPGPATPTPAPAPAHAATRPNTRHIPSQPAASARQQQLRQRLERTQQAHRARQANRPTPTNQPTPSGSTSTPVTSASAGTAVGRSTMSTTQPTPAQQPAQRSRMALDWEEFGRTPPPPTVSRRTPPRRRR
ncbi:hypothetical protein [Kitasatospora sp. GAS1066B]